MTIRKATALFLETFWGTVFSFHIVSFWCLYYQGVVFPSRVLANVARILRVNAPPLNACQLDNSYRAHFGCSLMDEDELSANYVDVVDIVQGSDVFATTDGQYWSLSQTGTQRLMVRICCSGTRVSLTLHFVSADGVFSGRFISPPEPVETEYSCMFTCPQKCIRPGP